MSFHKMRLKDREITNVETLKKILKSAKYVTLALSMNNQPYLVSLSHGYDENHNCIYFHCALEGKKLEYLESNNLVWGQALLDYGCVEGLCDHAIWASVHFSGKVTFIDKIDEKRLAMEYMFKQLSRTSESSLKELDLDRLNIHTKIGRVDIDYMSGKKSRYVTWF